MPATLQITSKDPKVLSIIGEQQAFDPETLVDILGKRLNLDRQQARQVIFELLERGTLEVGDALKLIKKR